MCMSTKAQTGDYSHPASGMWTPTYLCTPRSGEGVVETFDAKIGQTCQGLMHHVSPSSSPSFAYEWVRSGGPSSISFETCPKTVTIHVGFRSCASPSHIAFFFHDCGRENQRPTFAGLELSFGYQPSFLELRALLVTNRISGTGEMLSIELGATVYGTILEPSANKIGIIEAGR
ncbi:hypothetical protein ARMGADRAFT_1062499 [Armillaria gallica]|uniref:Uncharacterized protein n=1 Tax=Armillaria gallica TaxID=47427 RepID=A0A2H3DU42_ARMGA|nr:hypothetical protein ARMGADRAFT_1062499 [Armillaria gallica]